jgi:hypothetical protein
MARRKMPSRHKSELRSRCTSWLPFVKKELKSELSLYTITRCLYLRFNGTVVIAFVSPVAVVLICKTAGQKEIRSPATGTSNGTSKLRTAEMAAGYLTSAPHLRSVPTSPIVVSPAKASGASMGGSFFLPRGLMCSSASPFFWR